MYGDNAPQPVVDYLLLGDFPIRHGDLPDAKLG